MPMNIRVMRERAGLTQAKVAAVMGVKTPAVSAWEAGAYFPSADKLPGLARVLGCRIDDLYDIAAYGEEINAVPAATAS